MLNSTKGENYEKVNEDGSKFAGKSGRIIFNGEPQQGQNLRLLRKIRITAD
jgi:hypothetical protein